jgi:hypothetical protein
MTTGRWFDAQHGIRLGAYCDTIVPGQVERNYRRHPSYCVPAGVTLPQCVKRHRRKAANIASILRSVFAAAERETFSPRY